MKFAFASGQPDRLADLAGDLVRAGVHVVVTTAMRETRAARQATSAIPIVMTIDADPVGEGLVASLARPGGNVTGLTSLVPGLRQKHVELLRERCRRHHGLRSSPVHRASGPIFGVSWTAPRRRSD